MSFFTSGRGQAAQGYGICPFEVATGRIKQYPDTFR